MTHLSTVSVLLLLAVACGAATSNGAADASPNVITFEEIRAADMSNVYELIRAHHPAWLRKRGETSLENEGGIVVYIGNARIGGPDALRRISTTGVTSIRFLDAAAAQFQYGSGHAHGAIVVSRR